MYKFIISTDTERNVNLEYIRELETKLDINFPEVLVDYYLNYNSSTLKEFSFLKDDLEFSVDFILPLKYSNLSVEKILSFKDEEYVPETFIPLAEEIGGEDFYWDAANGKVYYLAMDDVEHPIYICDNVEEFFKLLDTYCNE